MSREALIDLLSKVRPAVEPIAARQPGPQNPEIEFPEPIRSRIEKLLQSVPELSNIESQSLRTISWGSSISFFRLAISVLERLSLTDDPTRIVDDLIDFSIKRRIGNYHLSGISGISIAKTLSLAPNIKLVTEDDIPPSKAREFIFRLNRLQGIVGDASHEILRPKVALMISNEQQLLIPNKSRDPPENALPMDTVRDLERRILCCLTLASATTAPVFSAKTSWIDHPAQSYHGLTGLAGGTSPGQQYSSRYSPVDGALVSHVFKHIDKMPSIDQGTLFLATERLRKSRLHEEPTDRAIDLGIALEIMLLHGAQGNQELSYRAAVHGARLLGANKKDRQSIFETLRGAYSARSAAVHTGQLRKQAHISSLELADALCRKVAIKIIDLGRLPGDWDSLVLD